MFLFRKPITEKNRKRHRYIYALIFAGNRCYIGQSVDLNRRLAQHKSRKGGWNGQKFQMVKLDKITGTYADAENAEFAWRICAQANNWKIYGLPPGVIVNPLHRATPKQLSMSRTCKWPNRFKTVGTMFSQFIMKLFFGVVIVWATCLYMGWGDHLLSASRWILGLFK